MPSSLPCNAVPTAVSVFVCRFRDRGPAAPSPEVLVKWSAFFAALFGRAVPTSHSKTHGVLACYCTHDERVHELLAQ